MKFLLTLILTIIFSAILQLACPWWVIVPVVISINLLIKQENAFNAYLSGFAPIFILWISYSTYIDIKNNAILSNKIALILGLKSSFLLIVITGFVGGLVGGLSSLSTFNVINLFKKPKKMVRL